MNKIKLLALTFLLIATYVSCNQTQETTEVIAADSVSVSVPVAIELKDASSDLAYDQYLHLKDVLVLSDSSLSHCTPFHTLSHPLTPLRTISQLL